MSRGNKKRRTAQGTRRKARGSRLEAAPTHKVKGSRLEAAPTHKAQGSRLEAAPTNQEGDQMSKATKILGLLLAVVLLATPAFAAWTVTETLDKYAPEYLKLHQGTFRIKLACTSDASSTTYTITNQDALGGYFYMVETIPSGSLAPDGTYDITVTNDLGTTMLSALARSTTVKQIAMASATLGGYPIMMGTKITITTLGNTKKTDIYLYYCK
jgi:hypothetical protein